MDASDLIKRAKDKTKYYNISRLLSTTQTGSNPGQGGLQSKTTYQFSTYELRQDYFLGRYNLALISTPNINCPSLSYQ
jgi:hypothetical protein